MKYYTVYNVAGLIEIRKKGGGFHPVATLISPIAAQDMVDRLNQVESSKQAQETTNAKHF
jgi:hypothetical protein